MLPVGEILRVAFCSGKTVAELSFGKFLNYAFDLIHSIIKVIRTEMFSSIDFSTYLWYIFS